MRPWILAPRRCLIQQALELPFLFRHAMFSWQDHPQPFVFRYAFKIVK